MSQLLSDNFQYANGDLHAANPNWVEGNGTFAIISDACYPSTFTQCLVYRTDISWPNDQYSEIVLIVNNQGANNGSGAAVRCSTNNGYALEIEPGGGDFQILKIVSGVKTPITDFIGATFTNGDVWRLTAHGNQLSLTQNGIPFLLGKSGGPPYSVNLIDNTFSSGSSGLFGIGGVGYNSVGFTNWAGGSVDSGGSTPWFFDLNSQLDDSRRRHRGF